MFHKNGVLETFWLYYSLYLFIFVQGIFFQMMSYPRNSLNMKSVLSSRSLESSIIDLESKALFPKLSEYALREGLDVEDFSVQISHLFTQYFLQTYQRYKQITLYFSKQSLNLKEVYLPLTWRVDRILSNLRYRINHYPKQIMDKFKKILVTGEKDSGKTTMLKRMYLDVVDRAYGIPFYILLDNLTEKHTILDEVCEQLNLSSTDYSEEQIMGLIRKGGFIFFIDMLSSFYRNTKSCDKILDGIMDFIENAGDNIFVVSIGHDTSEERFWEFQRTEVEALDEMEIMQLLRKYEYYGAKTEGDILEKLPMMDMKYTGDIYENPSNAVFLYDCYASGKNLLMPKPDTKSILFAKDHEFSRPPLLI